MRLNRVRKQRQPDRVTLTKRQMPELRCQHRRARPFAFRSHAATRIDNELHFDIRFGIVLFDEQSFMTSEQTPIDVFQIIARHVFAMRSEFDRKTDEGTLVKPVHEAFDHTLCDQFQIIGRAE